MAFAALFSLPQTLNRILNSAQFHVSDHGKKNIRLFHAMLFDMQKLVENLNFFDGADSSLKIRFTNAAIEVEDILESFRQERRAAVKPTTDLYDFPELKMAVEELQSIVHEAIEFLFFMERQTLKQRSSTCQVSQPSSPEKLLQDLVMVGQDKDLVKLADLLFDELPDQNFIAITGMGGIGKTALARNIYNHDLVKERFFVRAWATVSYSYHIYTIFTNLLETLKEVDPQIYESSGPPHEKVCRILIERKYLIVLDDIWTIDAWRAVENYFPAGKKGSRVMITTRSKEVASSACGKRYIHEMYPMDSSKSWELFSNKVFGNDRKCPNNLDKIGKQIVRKCDGLPLAILEAGTMLSEKAKSDTVWKEFLETMNLTETLASLELSYRRLPPSLKLSFLSLAFFKEGTTIRADRLVHVWIAGLMVPPNEGYQTDEESGKSALAKLTDHYLVQVKDRTRDYQVKNCDINYNLHRLAVKIAKEDLTFEVITKEGSNYGSRCKCKPRHRVVYCSRENFCHSSSQDRYLRSLFFHGGANFDASPLYWKSFELLNILDFEGFGLKTFPETIGTLVNLKYLGLRSNFIEELPRSLGQLRDLEVLDIALNFMVKVPNIIWEMDSLRHLYMSDIISGEPLKVDKLYNLRTLMYISVDDWAYEVSGLKMMTNLRKLGIQIVDGNSNVNVSKLFESMAKLEKLEHLILRGCRFRSMPELHELSLLRRLKQLKLDGLLTSLPSDNDFPPNIEYLSLSNSCLVEDPMPILQKLPKLVYLKLRNAFMGEVMEISNDGFARLKMLCLEELWHLRSIRDMRNLNKIEIKSCPYLKTRTSFNSNKLKMHGDNQ